VNIYPNCRSAFYATLSSPSIKASIEGTSAGKISGAPVTFAAANMVKGAGVRDGGAGNYNLQTRALDVTVTHLEGLDKDTALTSEIIPKLQKAFAAPAKPTTDHAKALLDEMREKLTPYWGGDIKRLGL
jgi:hypothetical protein